MPKKSKSIVVSGMRPTGKLHLGHYLGVIKNWVKLQEDYECYFFVADYHALTTEYADPKGLKQASRDMVLDWLAAGIDPDKSHVFLQSAVPEHAELHLLLSMITPISWLERVPSYKEMKNELKDRDLSTYGFLGYPLLQTADVAIYRANKVPVGQDQVAHLELSREIVRRFNYLYDGDLPEPQSMLTEAAKLPGIDGRKMSKSYGNAIELSESDEETTKKLSVCVTDPARVRRSDPGHPEVCNIFAYHQVFTPAEDVDIIASQCRAAEIGCVDCKKNATNWVLKALKPLREKRKTLEAQEGLVKRILEAGAQEAQKVALENLNYIREKMGLL